MSWALTAVPTLVTFTHSHTNYRLNCCPLIRSGQHSHIHSHTDGYTFRGKYGVQYLAQGHANCRDPGSNHRFFQLKDDHSTSWVIIRRTAHLIFVIEPESYLTGKEKQSTHSCMSSIQASTSSSKSKLHRSILLSTRVLNTWLFLLPLPKKSGCMFPSKWKWRFADSVFFCLHASQRLIELGRRANPRQDMRTTCFHLPSYMPE